MVLFMRKLTKHENTLSLPFVYVQYENGGQRLLGMQSINMEGASLIQCLKIMLCNISVYQWNPSIRCKWLKKVMQLHCTKDQPKSLQNVLF